MQIIFEDTKFISVPSVITLCTHPVLYSVKELTVSAGDNIQVMLPKNEVELNAFAVPPPSTGELNALVHKEMHTLPTFKCRVNHELREHPPLGIKQFFSFLILPLLWL